MQSLNPCIINFKSDVLSIWLFSPLVFIDMFSQMKQESALSHGFIYLPFTIKSLVGTDGHT